WPAYAGSDQGDPGQVVYGRLVLGEHDQGRAGPVQPRVHPAGDLLAPGEREPDVDVVGHLVGLQGPPDLLGDLLIRGHRVERERLRRAPQPGQVLGQPENAPLIKAQALPDRVPALHCGVELADRRLVAVGEAAAHVHDDVDIAFVEGLEHGSSFAKRAGRPPGGGRAGARNTAGTARPGPRARRAAPAGARGRARTRWTAIRSHTSTGPTPRRCHAARPATTASPG